VSDRVSLFMIEGKGGEDGNEYSIWLSENHEKQWSMKQLQTNFWSNDHFLLRLGSEHHELFCWMGAHTHSTPMGEIHWCHFWNAGDKDKKSGVYKNDTKEGVGGWIWWNIMYSCMKKGKW
jgi:hypothetical protein